MLSGSIHIMLGYLQFCCYLFCYMVLCAAFLFIFRCLSPKGNGGLGVIDLKVQNQALLMKFLHKFLNKEDIPWVLLIWHTYYSSGKIPYSMREKGSF